MKPLLLLLIAVAAGTAVTAGAMAATHPHSSSAAAPPQHLTMQIVNDHDQMLGPNLIVRPGAVVLRIVNYAHHAHTFSVPALGIEHVVLPGSPTRPTVTVIHFRAPYGTFAWYCRLPCKTTMSGDVYANWNPPRMHGQLWATA